MQMSAVTSARAASCSHASGSRVSVWFGRPAATAGPRVRTASLPNQASCCDAMASPPNRGTRPGAPRTARTVDQVPGHRGDRSAAPRIEPEAVGALLVLRRRVEQRGPRESLVPREGDLNARARASLPARLHVDTNDTSTRRTRSRGQQAGKGLDDAWIARLPAFLASVAFHARCPDRSCAAASAAAAANHASARSETVSRRAKCGKICTSGSVAGRRGNSSGYPTPLRPWVRTRADGRAGSQTTACEDLLRRRTRERRSQSRPSLHRPAELTRLGRPRHRCSSRCCYRKAELAPLPNRATRRSWLLCRIERTRRSWLLCRIERTRRSWLLCRIERTRRSWLLCRIE